MFLPRRGQHTQVAYKAIASKCSKGIPGCGLSGRWDTRWQHIKARNGVGKWSNNGSCNFQSNNGVGNQLPTKCGWRAHMSDATNTTNSWMNT